MEKFNEHEVAILHQLKKKTIGVCERCENGWLQKGDSVTECECRKVFIFLKELIYARIPQEYWGLKFGQLKLEKLVKMELRRYFKNFDVASEKGLGFCMTGTNGTGKTSLLAEIGKLSVRKGINTIYITAQDYINYKMLNDYDNISRIENADVILLDEIDKPYQKKGSDYVLSQLESLLRNVLPKNKVLHIASNWTQKEIKHFLGDSVFSIMLRKLKFISILGEDKSEDLQNDWNNRIDSGKIDYLDEYFIKMAEKMKRFKI